MTFNHVITLLIYLLKLYIYIFKMISENIKDCDVNLSMECQNLNIFDSNLPTGAPQNETNPHINDKALRMMQKMGYKTGSGLGKSEQGITKTIDVNYQFGKKGLGSKMRKIEDACEKWDFSLEEVSVKEELVWLINKLNLNCTKEEMSLWVKEGEPISDITTECHFCDQHILKNVIEAKNIFDEMDIIELCQARAKANPFESIKSVFFMNRAALKMANIDAVTNFMFTDIDKNEHFHEKYPIYFADVCAGPGGFTEYILWRKKWSFKGFGLTLKGKNDFKLHESTCANAATFQAFYGKDDDGNVCSPDNILDFKQKVLHETEQQGVHFMMSDGGFSVEGNENFQEILSKNIYICQCLVALEIVRSNGHFVTKLFDVFTPFSVGLLFLMYKCFEKVSILKPNSSRPANSERYFICSNLKRDSFYEKVKNHLWTVVNKLWKIKDNKEIDVLEIVPLNVLKTDQNFYNYIVNSNESLAIKQTIGLKKLGSFCRNPTLTEIRQEDLRKKCLEFWKIPDKHKSDVAESTANELMNSLIEKPEIISVQTRIVDHIDAFNKLISDIEDWYYFPLYSSKNRNHCNFYAGVNGIVYRLQKGKWIKIKNVQLCPGTVVFGEFVKEKCVKKGNGNESTESVQYSLHIIDGLRLGDTYLTDMTYSARQEMLKKYCKSVNKEGQTNLARVRIKIMDHLSNITSNSLVTECKDDGTYSNLPLLGYNSVSESFRVNSLLLFKVNSSRFFHQAYVLRVTIFLTNNEENPQNGLLLEDILGEIIQKT